MTDKETVEWLRVKPLEWVTPSPTTDGQWQDTTGIYDIEECILFIGHVETGIRFDTDCEAKAAAQDHHERHIRAALTAAQPSVEEAPPILKQDAVDDLLMAFVDHDDARDEDLAMVIEWYAAARLRALAGGQTDG